MLVLYFVWGSTYIAIRLAVETIPPFLMAGHRFLVAGLILLGWEWIAVRRIRAGSGQSARTDRPGRPTRRQLRDSAIVGGLLLGGGMGLVALGERTVPAGITAFLIAMLPVWVAVFGRAFFGERLPRAVLAGVIVGIVGVAILVGPVGTSGGGLAFDPLGLAVLIASPMCWATGSLYSSQRAVLPRRPLTATGFQMLFGSAILLVAAVLTGELRGFDPSAISARSAAGLLYLIVFGSLLAFTTFVWLLRVAPLPKVATYAYINPIVAIVLAGLVLGEPIEPRTAIAGAVIVAGVALIVTARGRSQAVESVMPTPPVELSCRHGRSSRPDQPGRGAGFHGRSSSRPARAGSRAQPSLRIVRETRRARAITVIIGFAPIAVGKSEASATYRPPTTWPARPVRTRPSGSHGWLRPSLPIRTEPIWWAEKSEPRFGRKSNGSEALLEVLEGARLAARSEGLRPVPQRRRAIGHDLEGARRPGDPGHLDERVAEGGRPARIEGVVDPDRCPPSTG